jgi:carbonic anhydrase
LVNIHHVQEQVYHLAETASVRNMWADHQIPHLHGWVFNLRTGLLNEVINLSPPNAEN